MKPVSVFFQLDKKKAYKRNKALPVLCNVRYTHDGKPVKFRWSIGITCGPSNLTKQQIHGREVNADTKNKLLNKIKEVAEQIYHDGILDKGSLPEPKDFKAEIEKRLTDVPTEKSTLGYYDDYLQWLEARKKSKSFIAAMTGLKNLLIELKAKGTSIRFNDIDATFETRLRELMEEKGYKKNTVASKIKRLRLFLGWAYRNNLHQNQKFKLFQAKEEPVEIVALTEAEIATIAGLSLPVYKFVRTGGTPLIRDWLCISCECGLRYSDFNKIAKPELLAVPGGYDVKIRTLKTGAVVTIPVSKLLYEIFQKYDFNVPLPPSNQKYNAGLTRIAERAGITKKISSHSGRKSFATNMYLKGIPVQSIMKVTGHVKESEFYKYLGVSGTENAALIRKKLTEQYTIEPVAKMAVNR